MQQPQLHVCNTWSLLALGLVRERMGQNIQPDIVVSAHHVHRIKYTRAGFMESSHQDVSYKMQRFRISCLQS